MPAPQRVRATQVLTNFADVLEFSGRGPLDICHKLFKLLTEIQSPEIFHIRLKSVSGADIILFKYVVSHSDGACYIRH